MSTTVLIVDDETSIRRTLAIALRQEGFEVAEAANAFEAKKWLSTTTFNIVLLDLGLPDEDGLVLLTKMRSYNLSPVIVLSVRDSVEEKITALDSGAQDYMTKPFSIAELCARIRVVLREHTTTKNSEKSVISDGTLTIDINGRQASVFGQVLELTPKEYEVLAALARSPNALVTQSQLLCDIWGPTYVDHVHYIRIVVSHLRRKIAAIAGSRTYIATVQGTGYRLMLNQSAF